MFKVKSRCEWKQLRFRFVQYTKNLEEMKRQDKNSDIIFDNILYCVYEIYLRDDFKASLFLSLSFFFSLFLSFFHFLHMYVYERFIIQFSSVHVKYNEIRNDSSYYVQADIISNFIHSMDFKFKFVA